MPEQGDRKGDADALRVCEARLRAFFDESQDMILSLDAHGRITDINRAGVQLLGYDEVDEVIGRVDREFWSNPVDHEVFMHLIRENGHVKNFEVILTRKDGTTVFGLESATLVPGADEESFEMHAIVMDITTRIHDAQALWSLNNELVETNQKLKESQAMMVHQEKLASIGQLAAGIAHEINNPLGFLKSNHSALSHYVHTVEAFLREIEGRNDPVVEKARHAYRIDHILENLPSILGDCDDGYRRITEIVQHLRSLSRMDSEDARSAFDLNSGIRGALTVASNEVKYVADVSLALAAIPPVQCVEGEIVQVFLNIILNAAQAIKQQGRSSKGRIDIRSGSEDGRVWVEIEDDGPGIPVALQERIFEPFFTTKPAGQGTGLGLSISHDIVTKRHGGTLSVRSAPGHGSCFRIELPIERGS
jgi:PAS domain S-box-containing protein